MNKATTDAWLKYIEQKSNAMAEKAADHAGITDPQERQAFIDEAVAMFLDAEREYINEIETQRLTAFMRHMKPMFGNDTDAPVSKIKQSDVDRSAVREWLRAISEALIRLSGAVETMAEKTHGFDISPPGLINILRDSGQEAFGVGADAIAYLEQLLGVEIRMMEGETDPFSGAYGGVKTDGEMLGRPGVQPS